GIKKKKKVKKKSPAASGSVFPSEALGEAFGQTAQRGALVHRLEMHVEQAEALGVFRRGIERGVELRLGIDQKSAPLAEHFGQLMVAPIEQVVEWSVVDMPLGSVAGVVEDDDDGVETVAGDGRDLHAGHLKGAVADQHNGTQVGTRHLRAERGRYGEPHARVV